MDGKPYVLITVGNFLEKVLRLDRNQVDFSWYNWFLKTFGLCTDEVLKVYQYIEHIEVARTGSPISLFEDSNGLHLLAMMCLGGGSKKMDAWWGLAQEHQITA